MRLQGCTNFASDCGPVFQSGLKEWKDRERRISSKLRELTNCNISAFSTGLEGKEKEGGGGLGRVPGEVFFNIVINLLILIL